MKSKLALLVVSLVVALSSPALQAQEFSSLEERMSAAEFKAAGLDKLSAEELARLNEWLRGKQSLAPTSFAAPVEEDRRGFAAEQDRRPIFARIKGEFRGWRGKGDLIELDNGQVWEVTSFASQLSVKLQNPSVEIKSGMLDSWLLQVEGYNAQARVRRVR